MSCQKNQTKPGKIDTFESPDHKNFSIRNFRFFEGKLTENSLVTINFFHFRKKIQCRALMVFEEFF